MNEVIGVIGAMDSETAKIIGSLRGASSETYAGVVFHKGEYKGKTVVVVTSGIGKVNAACITQILIDRFQPGAVINTGIAGAVASHLKPCDIVVSTDVVFHDIIFPDGPDMTPVPYISPFAADSALIAYAEKACAQAARDSGLRYYSGRVASGDQFIADSARKEEIVRLCDPLCVEMEGAAIGSCAALNSVPFVVIRTMSDSADDEAGGTYYDFKEQTSNISASIVLSMIEQM